MQDLNPIPTSQTRVCTVANSQEIHIHGAVWEASLLNCTSGYRWTERGRRPWSVTPQSAPAALCLLYPNTMREEGGEKIGGHPKGGGNERKLTGMWASWHRLPDYLQVSCFLICAVSYSQPRPNSRKWGLLAICTVFYHTVRGVGVPVHLHSSNYSCSKNFIFFLHFHPCSEPSQVEVYHISDLSTNLKTYILTAYSIC